VNDPGHGRGVSGEDKNGESQSPLSARKKARNSRKAQGIKPRKKFKKTDWEQNQRWKGRKVCDSTAARKCHSEKKRSKTTTRQEASIQQARRKRTGGRDGLTSKKVATEEKQTPNNFPDSVRHPKNKGTKTW